MTSVTGTALNLYLEARKEAKKLVKNSIQGTVDIPFGFKEKGMRSTIKLRDDKLYLETNDKSVVRSRSSGHRLPYDHLLARYLLQNIDWGDKPKKITLSLLPTKRLHISYLKVKEIKQIRPRRSLFRIGYYYSLFFNIPVKNVDALDTVFAIYTEREPRLEDFLSKEMIKGHTAEADIRKLPDLPQSYTPREIKTREGVLFPVESIVEEIETYRKKFTERYKKTERDIKTITGEHPSKIHAPIKEFWKNNGFRFFGRIAKPNILRRGRWLSYGRIVFPYKLPLYAVGYFLNGRFSGEHFEVNADDYLNAKSVTDLIDESKLTLSYPFFRIKKKEIRGYGLSEKDIRKMFELATEISSIKN